MNLSSLEQQLFDVLEETHALQRSVLELLEQQNDAMIRRDLTILTELASSLVSRAEALHALEGRRAAITQQLSATTEDLGEQPSLQEIADAGSTPERRESMLELRTRLLETQAQVDSARDRNQTLADHVLEANDATLRNLMEALRDTGHHPDDRPHVLDRRA